MSTTIRLARDSDARSLLEIYEPIVRGTVISFEHHVPSEAEMKRRLLTTLERAPWLVCTEDRSVWGYAYAAPFRSREAYRWTVEVTVYVHPRHYHYGVGRALYTSLFECLRLQGYVTAVAVIALPNPASVRFHESFGFHLVGVFRSVGFKQRQWHDVGWWQLGLREPPEVPHVPVPLRDVTAERRWKEALASGLTCLRG